MPAGCARSWRLGNKGVAAVWVEDWNRNRREYSEIGISKIMSSTVFSSRPRMKRATPQTASIQSLDRGLFILEAVAKSTDPVGLGQLTDLLGINRSSVFRLANTLRRRG